MAELGEVPGGGAPFGGIVNASLPELQQTQQQLAQMQLYQNRIAQQQNIRQQALFDRMQNQEIAKVRSADAPDVANAFTSWRRAQIAAEQYKGRDATQYNQLSMGANQAYATAMQKIQKSAELKNQLVQMQADYKAHPDKYADNFPDLAHAMLDTPYGQLGNVKVGNQSYDLTNQNSYLYPGGNINYAQAEKEAVGTPKPTYTLDEQVPGGLQTKHTQFQYSNTPAEYKNVMYAKLAGNAGNRDAKYQLSRLTEDNPTALQDVNQAYGGLSDQDWLYRTGHPAPQNLEPTNPNNPAEVYASYLAKKYALDNVPRPAGQPRYVTNVLKQDLEKQGLAERMEGIRHNNREAERAFGIDYAKKSAQDQVATNELYVNKDLQDAQNPSVGGRSVLGPDGQVEYVSPGNAILENVLATGKGTHYAKPDEIRYNNDGTMVRGVFYQKDKNNKPIPDGHGGFLEAPNTGQPVTVESVKPLVGNQFKSLHQPVPAGPAVKTYTLPNGQQMSMTELLKHYPQDKINQYIQAGVLK